jgi:hypothetical protein
MVSKGLAPRRSHGNWQRLVGMIQRPGDILLSLELAYFIWRVPEWLDRMPLPQLLQRLQHAPRPASADLSSSLERVKRLGGPWFKLPAFRSRNTCYLRALMFYRFLDAGGKPMQIHFLVEPGHTSGDRLRGHAWVTIGREIIEPPTREILASTRSLYSFPPLNHKVEG